MFQTSQPATPPSSWAISPVPERVPSGTGFGAAPTGTIHPAQFHPGAIFAARYRIESLLGEGGMGAVYRAFDIELDRTIALKLVRPELALSPETVQRFKQELLLASKISHKNILRIHDLGDWGGIKYITMAFVEGTDLAGLIEREGRIAFERAVKFARQMCGALEAAHNEEVVHRDFKPQNILLDRSDNLYVSDFGLAKSLEPTSLNMTRSGQVMGSPQYMSPEQVEAVNIDHRSDLYCLGLILYEMFTGKTPFKANSAMQVMYMQVTERPKDPRTLAPELPEYIANVIMKCLEKDPAQRYQNAREVIADIDSHNAPVVSAPPPSTLSVRLPATWKLAAAGLAVAAGLVFAVPTTRHMILGSSAAESAAKPQHYMALLPMKVVGDDALKYIAEGVDDAITAKLSGLTQVYIAPGSAVAAIDARQDAQKTARALGVKIIAQGTAQGSGETISITISMNDVVNNRKLLAREFKGTRKDILTLEDQIFGELVKALTIEQSNQERLRTQSRPTQDVDAYDLYLKGSNLMRGQKVAANMEKALAIFNDAIARDPQFTLAYTGIAVASLDMFQITKDAKWTQQALAAAQQAQGLNDKLPEVHLALGGVYNMTGQTGQAIAELKRARELAPNSDEVLRRLARAYQADGRQQEALATYLQATEVNPYLWTNFAALGIANFRYGENQKAFEAYDKVTSLAPDNAFGWAGKGAAQYRMGRLNEAIPLFQKAIEINPSADYFSQLGVTYFFLGRYGESARMFETATGKQPNNSAFLANLADAYRWSNETAKAMNAYDQAITKAFKSIEVNPRNIRALGVLATSYAKKGDAANAAKFIQQARQIDREDNDLMYREATIYLLGGRTSEALASLGEALRNGYSVQEAKNDPELKALRDKPEFQKVLEMPSKSPK